MKPNKGLSMKVDTSCLKKMVETIAKVNIVNKFVPISEYIMIEYSADKLSFTVTDSVTTARVFENVSGFDFKICVDLVKLIQLITRIESTFITLTIVDNALKITWNANSYILPIVMDDATDEPLVMDIPELTSSYSVKVETKLINNVINTNKAALPKDFSRPNLTNYFCDEGVYTTNGRIICYNPINLFKKPAYIGIKLMDLLTLFKKGDFQFDINISSFNTNSQYYSFTDDYLTIIYAYNVVPNYPVDAIQSYLNKSFAYKVTLVKKDLLNALHRLGLFINTYDSNRFRFSINGDTLTLNNVSENALEKIEISENKTDVSSDKSEVFFEGFFDITTLITVITNINEATFDFCYNNEKSDNAIKIVAKDFISIINKLEKE